MRSQLIVTEALGFPNPEEVGAFVERHQDRRLSSLRTNLDSCIGQAVLKVGVDLDVL